MSLKKRCLESLVQMLPRSLLSGTNRVKHMWTALCLSVFFWRNPARSQEGHHCQRPKMAVFVTTEQKSTRRKGLISSISSPSALIAETTLLRSRKRGGLFERGSSLLLLFIFLLMLFRSVVPRRLHTPVGLIFWLSEKKLVGSYVFLRATNRS